MRIEPNDTYGYVSYGQILVEQGKLELAKEVYQYRLKELSLMSEAFKQTPSGLTLDFTVGSRRGSQEMKKRNNLYTG